MLDRGTGIFITNSEVRRLSVSIATDPRDQARGLLDAGDEFAGDVGMVFVFDHGRPAIWMRGMRIPIDILFIDAAGKIVNAIDRAQPNSGTYRSESRVLWVVELPAGTMRRLGLNAASRFVLRRD